MLNLQPFLTIVVKLLNRLWLMHCIIETIYFKEFQFPEDRGTGIPTIQDEL